MNGQSGAAGGAGRESYADEVCENCGSPMVLKRGRFGHSSPVRLSDLQDYAQDHQDGAVAAAPVLLEEKCLNAARSLPSDRGLTVSILPAQLIPSAST